MKVIKDIIFMWSILMWAEIDLAYTKSKCLKIVFISCKSVILLKCVDFSMTLKGLG